MPRAQASGDVALLKLFPGHWPGEDIMLAGAGPCLGAQREREGKDGRFPLLTPQLMLLQKHNWRKVWPT